MSDARLLIPTGMKPAAVRASRIDAPVRRLAGATMGTGWSLAFAAPADVSSEQVERTLADAFALVIRQMSGWEVASDLSLFNRAPAGWRDVPREFALVLRRALEIAEITGGAYDPTLRAAIDALGFGPGLEAGSARTGTGGWRDLVLDVDNLRAYQPGGVTLDLSSIAKGYAVDLCAEQLRGLGVPSFLMEIGGEFVGQGVKPDAQPWWVELELSDLAPAPGEPPRTDVALVNLAVATSGDFVRRRDGVAHIIDGRTGDALDGALSGIAVLHASAMEADGWATALFALGLERGMAMAEVQGLAVVFAVRTAQGARTHLSAGAQAMAG
jgi:FAD:protein FMN transferase